MDPRPALGGSEAADRQRKATIAALYDRVAPTYGSVGPPLFARAGQQLVAAARLAPSELVLDVGSGRGASLFPAAAAVGPGGFVIGVDLSAAMTRETAHEVRRRALRHVTVLRMDAEQLVFPAGTFDAVLCGFTIFFLDRERALREFRRVLRPGGRLGVSLAADGDPRWQWYNDLLIAYSQAHQFPLSPPAAGGAWDRADLPTSIRQAGFADVRETIAADEIVYASEDEWWAAKWTHGARYPLEQMPDALLARFKAEVFARLAAHKADDGFHEVVRLQCVIGTTPGP